MKKLVAYLRVSTLGQMDNTSLAHQLNKITAYCAYKDHELLAVYQDAESGTNMERSGFESAIKHVFEGGADGIIVWSLDRFARRALRGWQIIADLDDAGKELVVVNRDLDTTGPTGKLIRNILLSVAEYELALLKERLVCGVQSKKASGGHYGGQPRYGFKTDNGALIPLPEEQWTLRVMRRLYDVGISHHGIAQYLNRKNRPTKRGGTWTHRTVERILNAQEGNGYPAHLQAVDARKEISKHQEPGKESKLIPLFNKERNLHQES